MDKTEDFRKKIKNMFLARELYDVTTFEGMNEVYSGTVCKLWREIAEFVIKMPSKDMKETELEIAKLFRNTKYSETEIILSNVVKIKELRFDLVKFLGI